MRRFLNYSIRSPSHRRGVAFPCRYAGQRHTITTNKSNNPFHILGVPPSSSFPTVRKAFVKLALQHHPDTTGAEEKASEHFIRIRQAFERIRDGKPMQQQEEEEFFHETAFWTEDDFLQWFYEQTAVRLTSDQRRELVSLDRSRIPGAFYGGQHWDLARRLASEQDAFLRYKQQQEQRGGAPPPRSEAGASFATSKTKRSTTSNLRRKRQR